MTKSIVKKETAEVPAAIADQLFDVGGQGFEDTGKDDYAIPFLRILQSGSPQCSEDEPSYIEGAKPGMFFNTVTGELYDTTVNVIPVHYGRDFIEWKPNRGGFVKSHGSNPAILDEVLFTDDKYVSYLKDPLDPDKPGNVIQDARNYYVLIADNIEAGPIILSLVSSGLKHAKNWMTLLRALRIPGRPGELPMFAGVWELQTVRNENDDGKWYQIGNKSCTNAKKVSWVNKEQVAAALEASKLIKSGEAEVDYNSTVDQESTNTKQYDDKAPF